LVFSYAGDAKLHRMKSKNHRVKVLVRTPRFLRYFLLLLALLAVPASSFAGVFVSVNIAPPEMPVYEQPLCPGDGYMWTPGYWGYDPDGGYYWVPGTWVLAPYTGALWTPGYWGWGDGAYMWHGGYWGLHIGFYGGVNYGHGYFGHGYEGGYWNHGAFDYNRSINHIDVNRMHNVYEHNVNIENHSRAAFNGGQGGIRAEASPQERVAEHEQHISAVPMQQQHQRAAASNRAQFANINHGQPAVTATDHAGRQGFQQALAHPANPQAIQAARNAPATHGGQARSQSRQQAQPQAHQQQAQPQARQQQSQPQSRQQAQPQARQQQARPQQQQSHEQPQGGGEHHR